jgi:hypothetical protein
VPYFNATLGLLFNPNLEHSRLGHYWSTFDVLTNAFAAEALRTMAGLAARLGRPQAARWAALQAEVVAGTARSLGYAGANDTRGAPVYAELIGGVHYWVRAPGLRGAHWGAVVVFLHCPSTCTFLSPPPPPPPPPPVAGQRERVPPRQLDRAARFHLGSQLCQHWRCGRVRLCVGLARRCRRRGP